MEPTIEDLPEQDGSVLLSDERFLEIVDLAEAREEQDAEASIALRELATDVITLRQHLVITTGAFEALARSLDAVVYAANRAGDSRTVALIEAVLRHEGLLATDDTLVQPQSSLIIPDTKTTKKITHKGRVTEVSK